jgi:hypothetical protein
VRQKRLEFNRRNRRRSRMRIFWRDANKSTNPKMVFTLAEDTYQNLGDKYFNLPPLLWLGWIRIGLSIFMTYKVI